MRIHHTAIMASDLERSIDWYCRMLGFRLAERGEFEGTPLAFLSLNGGLIELVQGRGYPQEGVVNHLALAVEDLPAFLGALRTAGVRCLDAAPVPIWNGGRIAFCEGPDGELIELIEPTSDSGPAQPWSA